MSKDGKQSYYEVLDVSFNANPEVIRTAYIRAKNAYNRDSLAAYSLFDKEDSRKILSEIEEAYTVLSDSDKRRKYDESHGILSSESVYDSYHRGNHAVAAFARDALSAEPEPAAAFRLELDPFRRQPEPMPRSQPASVLSMPSYQEAAAQAPRQAPAPEPSHIERLKSLQELPGGPSQVSSKPLPFSRSFTPDPEMEEKIRRCENVNGAFLRSIREYKQMSSEEIMNILKISKNYLTALEEDDLQRLPATVFVRGFVIQYAKALKLDHERIASAYMGFLRSRRPG